MLLHSVPDIADAMSGLCLCDPFIKSFLGYSEKPLRLGSDLPNRERIRGIAIKPLHKRAAVYRNHVSVLQDDLGRGNPVHDLLVDRYAERVRETVVPQKSRNGSVASDEVLGDPVQLEGRHSRANVLGQLGQRSADQPVVLTEQLDLFRRFKVYHLAFERLSGSALDPSGLHQAVVVTQEQVAFNLLESVKNNAHQDQQRRTAIEQRELIVDSDNHGKSG